MHIAFRAVQLYGLVPIATAFFFPSNHVFANDGRSSFSYSPGMTVVSVRHGDTVDLSNLSKPFPSQPEIGPGTSGNDGVDGHKWVILCGFGTLYLQGALNATGQNGQDGSHGYYPDVDGGDGGNGGKGGSAYIHADNIVPLGDIFFDFSGGNAGEAGHGALVEQCNGQGGNGGDGGHGGRPGKLKILGRVTDFDPENHMVSACNRIHITSTGGTGGDGGNAGWPILQGFDQFWGTTGFGSNGRGGNSYHCGTTGPSFAGRGGTSGEGEAATHSCIPPYSYTGSIPVPPPGMDGQLVEYCPSHHKGSCDEELLTWPPFPPNMPPGVFTSPTPLPPTDPQPYPPADCASTDSILPCPVEDNPGDPTLPENGGGGIDVPPPLETDPQFPPVCQNLPGDLLTNPELINCNESKWGYFLFENGTQVCSYGANISFAGETTLEAKWRDRVWKIQPAAGTKVNLTAYSELSPYMIVATKTASSLPALKLKSYGESPAGDSFVADGSEYYIILQTWSPIADFRIRVTCTPAPTMTEIFADSSFAATSGWSKSGTVTADVQHVEPTGIGSIGVSVLPTAYSRSRIAGWSHPDVIPPGVLDVTKLVRGKFYISTDNAASDPVNHVPNFRLRLDQGGTVLAENHYQHAATGSGGVPYEPFYDTVNNPSQETKAGVFLQPSRNPSTPSLYRIDYYPIDVAAAGTVGITATFESYTTLRPSEGTLLLQEFAVGTYPKPIDSEGKKIFEYKRGETLAGGIGGPKSVTTGAFNSEADFQAGRLQELYLPGEPVDLDGDGVFAPMAMASVFSNEPVKGGVYMDTTPVPAGSTQVFANALTSVASIETTRTPRLKPGKLYKARFYATSSMVTYVHDNTSVRQANTSFRLQTANSAVSAYLRLNGCISYNAPNMALGQQVIPGIGCQNPEVDVDLSTTGEDGGWYTILLSSPLDPDIRPDNGADFGLFGMAPDYGTVGASAKDILLGADVQQLPTYLKITPEFTAYNLFPPNRSKLRITCIQLYEFDQIYDGGY